MARRNRGMCVKIAQDVLAQIRLNRYKATSGTYIEVDSPELNSLINSDDLQTYDRAISGSFKDFFKNNKKTTCQVCALGAAFVSLVNIENKCSVESMVNEDGMWSRLEKYFGSDNMDLMEAAFERDVMRNANSELSDEVLQEAAEWGRQYSRDEERLRAIMLNVIRNKGDFKLPQKYLSRARRLERENAW